MEIYEAFQSAAGKNSIGKGANRKVLYHVLGSDNDLLVMNTVYATAPETVATADGDLIIDDVSKTQIGPGFWAVEVNYIDPQKQQEKERPDQGELIASWDTTGGTQHITTSLETMAAIATNGWTAHTYDFGGGIEVTVNGVNGTDVVVAQLQLELEYRFPNASVTDTYIRKLRDLTGTTNNATWKGWAQGDLLFLGSSGRQSNAGDITARFIFSAGKSVTSRFAFEGKTSNPAITKRAHDHLWYYYRELDNTTDKRTVYRPISAYVERVYEESDFLQLAIGS